MNLWLVACSSMVPPKVCSDLVLVGVFVDSFLLGGGQNPNKKRELLGNPYNG